MRRCNEGARLQKTLKKHKRENQNDAPTNQPSHLGLNQLFIAMNAVILYNVVVQRINVFVENSLKEKKCGISFVSISWQGSFL